MDRNNLHLLLPFSPHVATREGGVDRNNGYIAELHKGERSPPARVAWIETKLAPCTEQEFFVATREGGVDRNVTDALKTAGVESRHPRGWRG